ncbi:MAG TPA: VWA domain-containing protein [Anaerolineales bacterium]|nr:VWA domain-containing protein [Anaerolineales bacterium]
MGLLWPGFLLLLGLIPLLVAVYIWILRRRRRFALRFSSLALVREALPHQSRLRRYLPLALFLLAVASLVVALGRPIFSVSVPSGQANIILAIDVSRSMCSTDIQPNRLEAAKDAALSFVKRQTASTQIGIVAFAGFAVLAQPPTADQEVLQDAIDNLSTARRTAIGSAILESLDAIAELNQNVAPSGNDPASGVQPVPVPEGEYAPDIIVLLTDGVSNSGPLPLDAAQQAVDRGIRIYTIGFGTENGSVMDCGDQFWGGGAFGGGQQFQGDPFGGGFRRGIDETTLKQISEMTGGDYYSATSAGELQSVFQSLPTYLITRQETMEISVAFAALGALLAAFAIFLSLLWHPLP